MNIIFGLLRREYSCVAALSREFQSQMSPFLKGFQENKIKTCKISFETVLKLWC